MLFRKQMEGSSLYIPPPVMLAAEQKMRQEDNIALFTGAKSCRRYPVSIGVTGEARCSLSFVGMSFCKEENPGTCDTLEDIIVSEITQSPKHTYCVSPRP